MNFSGMQTGCAVPHQKATSIVLRASVTCDFSSHTSLRAFQRDGLAVRTAKRDRLPILLHKKSGHNPAVLQNGDLRLESFANFSAWIHDVNQHLAKVVAFVGGQIGTDLASLCMQRVAFAAHLHIELLARIRVAGACQRRCVLIDLRLHFRRGRSFRCCFQCFAIQFGQSRISMDGQPADRVERQRRGGDLATIGLSETSISDKAFPS